MGFEKQAKLIRKYWKTLPSTVQDEKVKEAVAKRYAYKDLKRQFGALNAAGRAELARKIRKVVGRG